jgi:dual oxidase
MQEILDSQRPGCIPEYFNIAIPKCHPIYDPGCNADRSLPFVRSRHDFDTGYAPNHPREQLNDVSPWMDGSVLYGQFKAWSDAMRSFEFGELRHQGLNGRTSDSDDVDENPIELRNMLPIRNNMGLPLANPAPPVNESLFTVNRFWSK